MNQQRKYSVGEIDRMRTLIGCLYWPGISYDPGQRSAEIEDRLRTYMLNGTDPSELEAAAKDFRILVQASYGNGAVYATFM